MKIKNSKNLSKTHNDFQYKKSLKVHVDVKEAHHFQGSKVEE